MASTAAQVSDLLTAAAVAERWSTSQRFVYSLGERGLLPRVVLSRKAVRFRIQDVEAFEAGRLTEATA